MLKYKKKKTSQCQLLIYRESLMSKIRKLFIVAGILMWTSIHGIEAQQQPNQSRIENKSHRFYFGLELLWFHLNVHVEDIQVKGQKSFAGIGLGYEYLKPKAFYWGISLLSTIEDNSFNARLDGHKIHAHDKEIWFGNLDLRFGYTFASKKYLLTPFLGLGIYGLLSEHHKDFEENLPYLSGGLRATYECTPIFNIGFNAKIFRTFGAIERFKYQEKRYTEHTDTWGGEVGLPFTLRAGSAKKWDIQFEPYFLKLAFSEVQNIYGTRLLFGYHF